MKRVLPLLVMTLFLAGIFIVPSAGLTSAARLQDASNSITESIDSEMFASELPNDPVFRVAFYNETSTAVPSWGTSAYTSNYSIIMDVLDNSDYDVTYINGTNVQNYELTTANFDVLILADNVPKDSVVDITRDFWLGGGGVLALDSAAAYLGYAGILPMDNESVDDGYNIWWRYVFGNVSQIVEKTPISQSYANGSLLFHEYANWGAYNWTKLMDVATYSGELKKIAVLNGSEDFVTALSIDGYRGGRAAYFGIPVTEFPMDWENMVLDAIAWLAPKPKARIAFDFSHQPRLSIDDWDEFSTLTDPVEKFSDLRDLYVSNRYTVDKFTPSSTGNFTEARLAEYDIMILVYPDLNYTEADRTALMAWLDAGGGLVVLGDRNQMLPVGGHLYLNFLLEDLDMYLGENNTLDVQIARPASPMHPTIGGMGTLQISLRNYIYLKSSAAQSVWEYDGNIAVAAQEYGSGRVVMFCDINILSNSTIYSVHNLEYNSEYALNVANWLSADEAEVLLYTDDPYGGGTGRNIVSEALNQLQIPFYRITTAREINATLNGTWYGPGDWDLVIIDNCNWGRQKTYPHILDYLKAGESMILTSWTLSWYSDDPLWSYIGVNSTGHWPSNQAANIWDSTHPIFDGLVTYGASTLNVSGAAFGTDGSTLDVYENATALAGYTTSEQEGNATIVISNNGQILLNGFLLNNLRGDADDSAYLDGFEIYMNEITFMLALPTFDHPADIQYEQESTGHSITWNPTDSAPSSYQIFIDGSVEESGTWSGAVITADVDGLDLGEHIVECRVVGDSGEPRGDIVVVRVVDTTNPLINNPADITMAVGSTGNAITWVVSDPNPDYYIITMNTTEWDNGTWDGSSIVVDLDDLDLGIYFFTVRVNDTLGHYSEDTVMVTVTTGGLFGLDTTTLILIAAGIVALIIIAVVCSRRRGSQAPAPKPRAKKKK